MFLEKIENVNDIKKIDPADYPALAQENRDFLIEKIFANLALAGRI